MTAAESITAAINAANVEARPALVPFLTAGFPEVESFSEILVVLAEEGDVVEIGVPFTDPLADGITIQKSSETALENGVSLDWILDTIGATSHKLKAPVLLMSYLNPLLAMGYEILAKRAAESGVAGFIVPDLPFEESAPLREQLEEKGLALVQLVSPVSSQERISQLAKASGGFVYAVTVTGVTGGGQAYDEQKVFDYLDQVRAVSPLPVCAGFGIRDASQVRKLAPHADGVIVGSALVEVLAANKDPRAFLRALRID